MKAITFYSYKGGVGRSLALSNIAIRLSELGKSVCVLDFDLEAPGLHYKFRKYDLENKIDSGIVDYIAAFVNTGHTTDIKQYAVTLTPHNKYAKPIQLIPAGDINSSEYWQKLSLINWSDLFYKEDSQGLRFFLNLKEKIKDEFNPDFLLIDSRTGITDIAGITLKILADHIVILAANNEENKEGSIRIIRSLLNKENNFLDKEIKINFVLTRLPFTQAERNKEIRLVEQIQKQFKNQFPETTIPISVIHSDRRLEENEQHLIGYELEEGKISIENDYLQLFDEVCLSDLNQKDILDFQNKKRAEKLYEKALKEKNINEKIKLFTEAINLNPNEEEYIIHRAYESKINGKIDEAEKGYISALKLNEKHYYANNNLAIIYDEAGEFEKAIHYYNNAILIDSENPLAIENLAICLDRQGNYEKAFKIVNDYLINIDNENPDLLNSRADLFRKSGNLEEAIKDIRQAIKIKSNKSVYYATLAEIYFEQGKMDDFYFNLSIALGKGIDEEILNSAKDLYQKLKDDPEFLKLLDEYQLDIAEILK